MIDSTGEKDMGIDDTYMNDDDRDDKARLIHQGNLTTTIRITTHSHKRETYINQNHLYIYIHLYNELIFAQ